MADKQLELVGEANHRIANHLTVLATMVQRRTSRVRAGGELIPRDEVASALTDLHGTIIAIARLHRTIAAAPARGEIDLAELLTGVLLDFKTIFQDRLRFDVSIPSCFTLDGGQTSILLQAFAEIVANAMKYAHPTGLPVELTVLGKRTQAGGMELIIADDGVGLPERPGACGQEAMGLRLVQALVESMAGQIEINSSPLGLTVSIRLRAPPRAPVRVRTVKRTAERWLGSTDSWHDRAHEARTIPDGPEGASAKAARDGPARLCDSTGDAARGATNARHEGPAFPIMRKRSGAS